MNGATGSGGDRAYEMLSGDPPFDGDNPIGIMMDQAQAPIPSLKRPYANTMNYGRLEFIIQRCLQKNPSDRFHLPKPYLKS